MLLLLIYLSIIKHLVTFIYHDSATVTQPSTSKATKTPNPNMGNKKAKLLENAPVVPFGADLEHWENRDQIQAPLVVKYVLLSFLLPKAPISNIIG